LFAAAKTIWQTGKSSKINFLRLATKVSGIGTLAYGKMAGQGIAILMKLLPMAMIEQTLLVWLVKGRGAS
jgi:hypothetical protein